MSSSANTVARVKTSLRPSIGRPMTCSGDMYPSFPRTWPSSVRCRCVAHLAMPKSVSFTCPDDVRRMLAGLTSRWTKPSGSPSASHRRCAYASAWAVWLTM